MPRDHIIESVERRESNSSVFEKTTPQLRRQINQALIERDPPTYKGVFARFKLAEHGLSYFAFCRYARRIRSQAAMFELAEQTASAGVDLPDLLPRALAQRLIETLAFEDVSPRHLQRLTDAYKAAVNTQVAIRRHGLFRKKGESDAGGDVADLMLQYRDLVERQEVIHEK